MDTKTNYALVGIFVIVLTGLMMIGFVWLSGFSQHKNYQIYLVYARGGVTGLTLDSPVLFNGVHVGSVKKITLDKSNPQFVKLYLKIERRTPITESTVATLIPQGITGLVYVSLKAESAVAPLLKADVGQPYPTIPFQKPILTQITEVLPDLARNFGDISEKIKKAFSDSNLAAISGTLNHLDNLTGVISQRSAAIDSSLQSLNQLLKNSATASQHFNDTLRAAQQTAEQLTKVSAQASLQINNLGQQMLPSVEELVARLTDTSASLQQMSREVAGNPAVLIRGKQPSPPGPGE